MSARRVKVKPSVELRWTYRGRTDTWCLDLRWWKATVYRDREGWKWLWSHSSDPFESRKEAQAAAEKEVVRKFRDIEKRMKEVELI